MFKVIVADNPWRFGDKLTMSKVKRGADAQYKSTLSFDEIMEIGRDYVKPLADEDALILSWVPSSMLKQGIQFVEECGFEVSGTVPWVKVAKLLDEVMQHPRRLYDPKVLAAFIAMFEKYGGGLDFGMGHTFRQCHEIAIEGRRGKIVSQRLVKNERSVHFARNEQHSKKPERLQDQLDRMYEGDKLELFARRLRPGWYCYGNEIDGRDIRESLDALHNECIGPRKVKTPKEDKE